MNEDKVIIRAIVAIVIFCIVGVIGLLLTSEQRLRCMEINQQRPGAEVAMLCKT